MFIKTNRLIIRDFIESDASALFDIKYDEEVVKYNPTFIKRDATIEDINKMLSSCKVLEAPEILDENNKYNDKLYAISLKDSDVVIGVIIVNLLSYFNELQIGWMINSDYTKKGYASEAGTAVSDYLLMALSLDYISVVMDTDNPASFRTAQKSGFRLFEKRYPYDYFYRECNDEAFDEVSDHFKEQQKSNYEGYYYFRKYNKNSKIRNQFYGDIKYDGRFS